MCVRVSTPKAIKVHSCDNEPGENVMKLLGLPFISKVYCKRNQINKTKVMLYKSLVSLKGGCT